MFIVSIPSYRRSHAIISKTLSVLRHGRISLSDIFIFVVAEEAEIYKKALPDYQIVTGLLGLRNQRNFIQSYFPIGTNIVMMDDDIQEVSEIYYEEDMYKPSKKPILNLNVTFENMFTQMVKEEVTICGVYPIDNAKFALGNPSVSLDFRYVVGAMYLIINTRDPQTQPQICDSHEDKERTILYFLKEHKILRFNHICIKTKYFASGGLDHPDRKIQHYEFAKTLVQMYPEYLRLKIQKKNGLIDCGFKKVKVPLL